MKKKIVSGMIVAAMVAALGASSALAANSNGRGNWCVGFTDADQDGVCDNKNENCVNSGECINKQPVQQIVVDNPAEVATQPTEAAATQSAGESAAAVEAASQPAQQATCPAQPGGGNQGQCIQSNGCVNDADQDGVCDQWENRPQDGTGRQNGGQAYGNGQCDGSGQGNGGCQRRGNCGR